LAQRQFPNFSLTQRKGNKRKHRLQIIGEKFSASFCLSRNLSVGNNSPSFVGLKQDFPIISTKLLSICPMLNFINANNLTAGLKIGQQIIIPGGSPISQYVPATVTHPTTNTNYTGLSAIRDLIKAPVARVNSSGMLWPTVGHNITQYFSWHHTAVDIANHIGTPIYAAANGVVLIAQGGWNGGYGNTILLDNGNNMRTRYGHASKLLVSPGEKVSKGQIIALMGSTGNSTGPHLHFEVVIGGVKYNPLNYVR